MGPVVVDDEDLLWLRDTFPGLSYDPNLRVISGDLDFCALYDLAGGFLTIEGVMSTSALSESNVRLCDVFALRIELATIADSAIDWPQVYEVDGRCLSIAEALEISVEDLHVKSDGSCCLGIQIDPGPSSLKEFVDELVVPFFYRIAYVERFGIDRTRQDLWDEYRHGADGLRDRLRALSSTGTGRNSSCPCGSGRKYKRCCLMKDEERMRSLRHRIDAMDGGASQRSHKEPRAARRRRKGR